MSKKKLSFSFYSPLFFSRYIFSYSLHFSLLYYLLSLTQLFKTTPVLTPFGTSLLFFTLFTGRMASLYISSSFPYFLSFTLFTFRLRLNWLQTDSKNDFLKNWVFGCYFKFDQTEKHFQLTENESQNNGKSFTFSFSLQMISGLGK